MDKFKTNLESLSNQKVEVIENIALNLFSTLGYHNATIRQIANEAGISLGLIYNYFPSKDDLFKSIYLKGLRRIFLPLRERENMTDEILLKFIDHFFAEMEDHVQYWRIYFIVSSQPDIQAKYRKYIYEVKIPLKSNFHSYFSSKGSSSPVFDTDILFAVIDGICLNYLNCRKDYSVELLRDRMVRYLGIQN